MIASSSNQETSITALNADGWEVITSFLNEPDLPYMTLAHVNQSIREHIFNIVEEINHDRGYASHLLSNRENFILTTQAGRKLDLTSSPLLSYIFNYYWLAPLLQTSFSLPSLLTSGRDMAYLTYHILPLKFYFYGGYSRLILTTEPINRRKKITFLKADLDKYSKIIKKGEESATRLKVLLQEIVEIKNISFI